MKEIENLWEEARELSLGTNSTIDRIEFTPNPLHFLRDYVSRNKPCIISKSISHWPALSLWPNLSYLSTTLSTSLLSLHLTPTGRADSIVSLPDTSLCFASAHVERLLFNEAIRVVLNSKVGEVVGYLQQQNDCFRTEYKALGSDCEPHIDWASDAFGCLPEAVNLWIGNQFSETSFHKDHYENLYVVVSGQKHFLLLPPCDVHRLYIRDYPAAKYSYFKESGEWKLEVEKGGAQVPWCSVNPYPSPETKEAEMLKFPLYFSGPKPFHCTLNAGDILYLPSMWFHHVRQTPDDNGLTIALNYWYDMQFDIKYAYFNFLQSLRFESLVSPAIAQHQSSGFLLSNSVLEDDYVVDVVEDSVDTKTNDHQV